MNVHDGEVCVTARQFLSCILLVSTNNIYISRSRSE